VQLFDKNAFHSFLIFQTRVHICMYVFPRFLRTERKFRPCQRLVQTLQVNLGHAMTSFPRVILINDLLDVPRSGLMLHSFLYFSLQQLRAPSVLRKLAAN
jgi:hypothetical protein